MGLKISQRLLQVLMPMGMVLQVAGLHASDGSEQPASKNGFVPKPHLAFVRTAQLPSELQAAASAVAVATSPVAAAPFKPPVPPMTHFRPVPAAAAAGFCGSSAGNSTARPSSLSSQVRSTYYEFPGGDPQQLSPFSPPFTPRPGTPDSWWF